MKQNDPAIKAENDLISSQTGAIDVAGKFGKNYNFSEPMYNENVTQRSDIPLPNFQPENSQEPETFPYVNLNDMPFRNKTKEKIEKKLLRDLKMAKLLHGKKFAKKLKKYYFQDENPQEPEINNIKNNDNTQFNSINPQVSTSNSQVDKINKNKVTPYYNSKKYYRMSKHDLNKFYKLFKKHYGVDEEFWLNTITRVLSLRTTLDDTITFLQMNGLHTLEKAGNIEPLLKYWVFKQLSHYMGLDSYHLLDFLQSNEIEKKIRSNKIEEAIKLSNQKKLEARNNSEGLYTMQKVAQMHKKT